MFFFLHILILDSAIALEKEAFNLHSKNINKMFIKKCNSDFSTQVKLIKIRDSVIAFEKEAS